MAITLGSNIPSLKAQRELNKGTDALSKVFERLSSGQRINRASDDAAGLAIASSLNSDTRIFTKAIQNISDSTSALTIAQGALQSLGTILTRQGELAEQASNGILSIPQRTALQSESDALTKEYNRILSSTTFNGIQILNGSGSTYSTQVGGSSTDIIQQQIGGQLSHNIGTGAFNAGVTYANALTNTRAAKSTDLNNDGYDDVVVGDQSASGGKIDVLLSNGDGTFAISQSIAGVNPGLSEAAYDIQFGDANGDSKTDLLVVERSNNTIGLYLSNGNGTFQARQQVAAVGQPMRANLSDMNGDGINDLIYTTHANLVYYAQGNGNGTFKAAASSSIGDVFGGNDGADFGDFNGDGIIDVVSGDYFSATVSIVLGSRSGTFSPSQTLSYPTGGSRQVANADFNRDGKLDFVVTSNSGLAVFIGNGNGTFQSATTYAGNVPNQFSLEAKDFNNDGYADMLASNLIFLGNGNGTFQAGATVNAGGFADSASGDFNGDGAIDLLLTTYGAGYTIAMSSTVRSTTIEHLNIMKQSDAREALTKVTTYNQRLLQELGAIGSQMSRLDIASSFVASYRDELKIAGARIMDADVALESSELVRRTVLQQAASAVLVQANQLPALSFKLLQ